MTKNVLVNEDPLKILKEKLYHISILEFEYWQEKRPEAGTIQEAHIGFRCNIIKAVTKLLSSGDEERG